MSAAIRLLQISNPETKKRISAAITGESSSLSSDYEISLFNSRENDIWELWITRPDGSRITSQLNGEIGEMTAAVFRVRLRELIKAL